MRTIKFRAWDRVEKQMVSVNLLDWRYPSGLEVNGSNVSLPGTLMQLTGLLDKNGKEIYESDLIKFRETPPIWPQNTGTDYEQIDMVAVIEWDTEGADFQMTQVNTVDPMIRGFNGRQDIEVIGNIYENPELLKD